MGALLRTLVEDAICCCKIDQNVDKLCFNIYPATRRTLTQASVLYFHDHFHIGVESLAATGRGLQNEQHLQVPWLPCLFEKCRNKTTLQE